MLISTVVMFQAQNRETINSTWKVAVSFKIIMTTSVTRPCFKTQHQTCKTKTKTDFFLVSDRSCPKTDGLRPHHWPWPAFFRQIYSTVPRRKLHQWMFTGGIQPVNLSITLFAQRTITASRNIKLIAHILNSNHIQQNIQNVTYCHD